jgi:hypothetical protein
MMSAKLQAPAAVGVNVQLSVAVPPEPTTDDP